MAVDNGMSQIAQEMAECSEQVVVLLARIQHLVNRAADTGANDAVAALEGDTTMIPETAFDKGTFMNCNYGLLQFVQFMTNLPVAQGPYRQSFNKAAVLK